MALRDAALSGAASLLYGSILSPSKEANVGTSTFYADRLKNGLADMASFGALSAVSPYVGKGLESKEQASESKERASESKGGAIEPKDSNVSKVLSTPDANPDTSLQAMVNQAIKRIVDEKFRRSINKDESGVPGDDVLDMMDKSLVRRVGLVDRNVAAERAEGTYITPGDPNLATDPSLPDST